MSYYSRVYRERNAHSHDEKKEQSFFSGQNEIRKTSQNKPFFQAKLSVNQPGDSYEQEADSVASAVVNKTSNQPIVQQKKISSIQRLSTTPEEEIPGTNDMRMERDKEKPFQRMTMDPEKEKKKGIQKMEDPMKEKDEKKKSMPSLQRKESNTSTTSSPGLSSRVESSAGNGKPLPAKTLNEMNHSFGVDFGNVNIHDNSESANMNDELNAHAFTYGKDIYFNSGKYNPESSGGKFLLAHELTHVVQQEDSNQMINKQEGTTSITATQCDQNYINQLRCVIDSGGCANTRAGGIPTDEEIVQYNEDCKKETHYSGDNITPSSDQCIGPNLDCFDNVYICSKDLDTSPVGKHAFFRVGGPDPGNTTYSLQPFDMSSGSDCWQGVPGIDYASDKSADAVCDPSPISKVCLQNEYVKYPQGHYCTLGPNSNTFAGAIAKNCGVSSPSASGWTPGIDDTPPPPGTFAPGKYRTLLTGCETKDCS